MKKDLTFIHLGNDTRIDGLINFEKLRMIAKEVRSLTNMCSAPYDLLSMLQTGGHNPSTAMMTMNQLTLSQGNQTLSARKRKKSHIQHVPNPKKMFEEVRKEFHCLY